MKNICWAMHFRCIEDVEHGGMTIVYNRKTQLFGLAICGRGDHFVKRLGFQKAFGRSLSRNLGLRDDIIESLADFKTKARSLAISYMGLYNELLNKRLEKKFRDSLAKQTLSLKVSPVCWANIHVKEHP